MSHVLIKYAQVLICISAGEGSRHFSAFHYTCKVENSKILSFLQIFVSKLTELASAKIISKPGFIALQESRYKIPCTVNLNHNLHVQCCYATGHVCSVDSEA